MADYDAIRNRQKPPLAEETAKPTPLSWNDRGLTGKPNQIIAQDSRLLLGHKETKQIGVVLLGRFRRLYAFEPEHDAVTCIMMCPANQCSKTLHHLACPHRIFARLMPTARDGYYQIFSG